MPIYDVTSIRFDDEEESNPVDGYDLDVAEVRELGELYLAPSRAAPLSRRVTRALIKKGWLDPATRFAVEFDRDDITITVRSSAFAAHWESQSSVAEGGDGRFIAMAPDPGERYGNARRMAEGELNESGDREDIEVLELVESDRPILKLEPQFTNDEFRDPNYAPDHFITEFFFQSSSLHAVPFPSAWILVRVFFDIESMRIGFEVRSSDDPLSEVYDDDVFEWDLADWHKRPSMGFDPHTSKELLPTKDQLAKILVALDSFMETR